MKITNFALVIELDRHIEILLLKSDCVIVPGLGGFIASHVAARFDENDSMFIPPVRTLGFNPKLKINDSLLVQSYSETYDISYPEAYNRIENEVNELKQHIANNGSYELCDIGTLYINADGNIEFKPCEAGILTPELYSLSSFEMKKIAGLNANTHDKREKKAAVVPFATTNVQIMSGQPTDKHEQHSSHETKENDGKIQIRISAVRNFVAAVVAVIVFMLLGTPVNENNSSLQTSNIDNGIINKLVSDGYTKATKSSNDISLKPKATNINTATDKQDKATNISVGKAVKPQKKATYTANDYYCIVLASQVTRTNADAFVKKLISEGFDKAAVLAEKSKAIKVIYGQYKTQSDAYNALKELRGNEKFYDAWVYQVKN